MSIGGWGGWHHAVGASMLLENEAGKRIMAYCLLDRDYHTQAEIEQRLREAHERGVQLKIWQLKESENYLLVPQAISRVIGARVPKGGPAPTSDEVNQQIDLICADLKDGLVDQIANEILARERRGLPAANRAARSAVAQAWKTEAGRRSLVSGKEILVRLREWASHEFRYTFGPDDVAVALEPNEIAPEVVSVIGAISTGGDF